MSDAELDLTSSREDILRQLEDYASPLNLDHRRADLWRKAALAFAERGDPETAWRLWAEYLVVSLHAREPQNEDDGDRYLHPMSQWGSLKCPDPDSIPEVMVDHLEERLGEIANPQVKARYADFLWQRRRQHQHARTAIEAHLAIMEGCGEPGDHREQAHSARRALSLAFALKDPELVEVVVEAVTRVAEGWLNPDSEAYSAIPVIKKILENKRFRQAEALSRWEKLLAKALERESNRYVRRDFLTQLMELFQRLGRTDECRRCWIQIAEEWEREAEERESEILVAASLYQDAWRAYERAGVSHKMEEMKLKMRASYKRAEETEFATISHAFPLDLTVWHEQIDAWLKLEPASALTHLAACRDLIPNWAAAERQTTDLEKRAPLSQLIPTITVHDGRPVSQVRSDEERRFENVRRQYNVCIAVSQILLSRAFTLFGEQGLVDADSLVHSIKRSPVFPDDKIEIIRRGFERYVEGDQISAIHILVPHLEDCLRRFLGEVGGETTSVRNDKMREKPLDQVLEAEQIRAAFALISDQLWRYFEHVLVAETGLNLRNDVAHGLLRAAELNESNANVIVHLYLLLGLLRTKESGEA